MKQDNKKSTELLEKSARKHFELDIPGAYEFALQAIEEDPANFEVYYRLRTLVQTIFAGYPESFDRDRIYNLVGKSFGHLNGSPAFHSFRGVLFKLEENYDAAEDAFFRAVHLNRKADDTGNHHHYMFQLAYVYKNMENLEVFTRLALSMELNMLLYEHTRQVALPIEIYERRLFNPDFNAPPIFNVRKMQEHPGMFYMLKINETIPIKTLIKHLEIYEKNGIDFHFYHMLSEEVIASDPQKFLRFTKNMPRKPVECAAGAILKGYNLLICSQMEKLVYPLLKREKYPWNIIIVKCLCKESDVLLSLPIC